MRLRLRFFICGVMNVYLVVVIEEANWLTLYDDVEKLIGVGEGYDAVICLGNSFAHMMDSFGDQREQKLVHANKNILVCSNWKL